MNKLKLVMATTLAIACSHVSAANISVEAIKKDITYLASDDLKGRGNFTDDIDKAANYIAKRFKEMGLKTIDSAKDYKQHFNAYTVKPDTMSLTLNGVAVHADNVAIATTNKNIRWHSLDNVNIVTVGADGDLRATLREINQTGGNTLVIVNNKHAEWFKRYQGFFHHGLTKLSLENKEALVLVLSDEADITNIDLSAKMVIDQQSLTNVVGILPGKKAPNEVILYSAHYDHLGVKGSEGDTIYNGADDDASGTTAVINIADYYAKRGDNARTLMFAAFTAEEIGGFGSKHFSEQLNPDHIVAMINIEMIGKPSKFGAGKFWMTGFERSDLGQIMNKALETSGTEVFADPYPSQNLFYRSDNATLARLGVPAHSFSSTQLDKDQHYHKASDDLASLDLESMTKVINSLATATEDLVNGKATPSRVDTSKVMKTGSFY